MKLIIATRRSELAQVQTDFIIEILKKKYNAEGEKLLIETKGDKILDVSLDKIGGKGLFVKDIEIAMAEGKADAAIHSMKDVPYEVLEMFEIAAMPCREDVRDAFVSSNELTFDNLPKGARVGTSSRRRAAQLKMLRDDIEIVPIRGNVQTRLKKIKTENLDGIILAAAGLKRLNMEHIITNYFTPEQIIPAIGQGALGIEVKSDSTNADLFRKLDNKEVRICVEAERSFMRVLDGDCHSTIGAYATIEDDVINIIGIFEVNGKIVRKQVSGNKYHYINLGKKLAEKIMEG